MRQADRAPLHCAVMDARRKEVYGAAQCGEKTIIAENAMPLQDFLHIIQEAGESACFAGDAVRIYEKEIIDCAGRTCDPSARAGTHPTGRHSGADCRRYAQAALDGRLCLKSKLSAHIAGRTGTLGQGESK